MKQQQQLFKLYEQRDQVHAQQQALVNQSQAQPDSPYQNIHIEDQPHIKNTYHNQYGYLIDENQFLQQQLAQQMQHLNICIQFQEDKLNAVEKEAMQWLQGTGQNEKREVKRTENGICAESTLKSSSESDDLSTVLFLGVAALGLAAFIINEILLFLKAHPEVMGVGLLAVIAVFFLVKHINKENQA